MAKEQKVLYKIEGGTAEEQKRVQNAMDYLLSSQSWGIGKNLLNKAYKLHKKPVTIVITDKDMIGYGNFANENAIRINFGAFDNVESVEYNGKRYKPSLESLLSHELTHAGQKNLNEAVWKRLSLEAQIYQEVVGEQELKKHHEIVSDIVSSATYESAMKKLENFVDNFLIPVTPEIIKNMSNRREYKEYLEDIERPAVSVERLVSSRQEGGIRKNYDVDFHEMSPEISRRIMINKYAVMLGIDEKPHRKEINSWRQVVKDSDEETLPFVKTHSRIAQHIDSGKQH